VPRRAHPPLHRAATGGSPEIKASTADSLGSRKGGSRHHQALSGGIIADAGPHGDVLHPVGPDFQTPCFFRRRSRISLERGQAAPFRVATASRRRLHHATIGLQVMESRAHNVFT